MKSLPFLRSAVRLVVLGSGLAVSGAMAQGFQLQQHEPTAAGDAFFAVSRPWYAQRGLAMGLTLNYGKDPLLGGRYLRDGEFRYERTVISDQLAMHLGVAGAVFDRAQLSFSAPLMLLERGTPGFGVAPNAGMQLGDPRLGAMFRLWNSGDLTLHAGGDVWVPTGAASAHSGDEGWRGALRLAADGAAGHSIRWAVNAGVLLRRHASLNDVPRGPGTTGNAAQFGAGAGWQDGSGRLQVGPEVVFSTALDERALQPEGTRVELLLGGRYRITEAVTVGPALGVGVVRSPGTPAFRALLHLESSFGANAARAGHRRPTFTASNERPTEAPQVAAVEPAAAAQAEPVAEHAPEHAPQIASVEPPPAAQAEPAEERTPEPAPQLAAVEPAPAAETELRLAAVRREEPSTEPAPVQRSEPESASALELPPVVRGDAHVVHFPIDAWALSRRNREFLDALARSLRSGSGQVVIEGHGDGTGSDAWNRTLSTRRAEAVRAYLVKRGLQADRIVVEGLGAAKPVRANDTAKGRAHNRRVEVRASN